MSSAKRPREQESSRGRTARRETHQGELWSHRRTRSSPPSWTNTDDTEGGNITPSILLINKNRRLTLLPNQEPPASDVLQRFAKAFDLANRSCQKRSSSKISTRRNRRMEEVPTMNSSMFDDTLQYRMSSSNSDRITQSSSTHSSALNSDEYEGGLREVNGNVNFESPGIHHCFSNLEDDLPAFLSDIPRPICRENSSKLDEAAMKRVTFPTAFFPSSPELQPLPVAPLIPPHTLERRLHTALRQSNSNVDFSNNIFSRQESRGPAWQKLPSESSKPMKKDSRPVKTEFDLESSERNEIFENHNRNSNAQATNARINPQGKCDDALWETQSYSRLTRGEGHLANLKPDGYELNYEDGDIISDDLSD